jgi:hypothetical protein
MAIRDTWKDRIIGKEVFALLEKGGIDCKDCRRIVIDIPFDGVVAVYREDIDGRKFIDAILESVQKGEPLKVETMDDETRSTTDGFDVTAGGDDWVYVIPKKDAGD